MKIVKLLLLPLLMTGFLFCSAPAYGLDILKPACNSQTTATGTTKNTQTSPTCQQNTKHANDTVNPVVTTIHDAVDIIGLVAGIAAVIIIIYSGIRYILNGSNPEGQKQARSSLVGALIGLVIIALAWTIVNLAINLLS